MVKPTVPEVLPFIRAYRKRNPGGGSLHIILDDGNIHNDHVDFCIGWATKRGDLEGSLLAKILRLMSRTQRYKLYCTE